MNKLATKKSVLKNCNSYSPTDKRQKKKEKCKCPPITKKIKNNRRTTAKVRKVIRNANLLNEWAENESSRPEIYEKPAILSNLKKVTSDDSIIYIGSYKRDLQDNSSYIDLTKSSSDNLHDRRNLIHSKSLKTIYLSRNFDRGIKLKKSMATTSLITLPVIKKERLPKKLNSTTVLNTINKDKLSLLDIPEEYLDVPDISGDCSSFEKTKLTTSDHKMIDWILDLETDTDFSLSSSTSGYNSSLDTDTSIEKMCNIYNVNSKDKINHM